MDLWQLCLYCMKTYSYISAYITHLGRYHEGRIPYISAQRVPDDGSVFEHVIILYPYITEPHRDPVLHPSDNDSSDIEADSDNVSIDLAQPPGRRYIYSTLHLENYLAGRTNTNKNFNIFDNEIDLWSQFSCKKENHLVQWCFKRNLGRAGIRELFRNPTMATVSNFTLSQTVFKRLNKMCYALSIDSWKSSTVWHNRLADRNNLCNDDYTCFFYRNPVECIVFLMQQTAFRDNMLYVPGMELNDTEKRINLEVKSTDWWWNEQESQLKFVIATMILTASIATAATWRYNCPFTLLFRADTSYKLSGRQEEMVSIYESWKHWLND